MDDQVNRDIETLIRALQGARISNVRIYDVKTIQTDIHPLSNLSIMTNKGVLIDGDRLKIPWRGAGHFVPLSNLPWGPEFIMVNRLKYYTTTIGEIVRKISEHNNTVNQPPQLMKLIQCFKDRGIKEVNVYNIRSGEKTVCQVEKIIMHSYDVILIDSYELSLHKSASKKIFTIRLFDEFNQLDEFCISTFHETLSSVDTITSISIRDALKLFESSVPEPSPETKSEMTATMCSTAEKNLQTLVEFFRNEYGIEKVYAKRPGNVATWVLLDALKYIEEFIILLNGEAINEFNSTKHMAIYCKILPNTNIDVHEGQKYYTVTLKEICRKFGAAE